jgi:hypothetical protein
MGDLRLVAEVALGVGIGIVLAWWAIRTLERWSYLAHATPCWPTTPFEVEHFNLWDAGEAMTDCRYPVPVQWARHRLRRKWRRHCERLKGSEWSTEEILGLPENDLPGTMDPSENEEK